MNIDNKQRMLEKYNNNQKASHLDVFSLRQFFEPDERKKWAPNYKPGHFNLEINRNNVLDESLQKIVNEKLIDGRDPLKCSLLIRFEGEPGEDWGGLSKEYFALISKELFNP